MRYRVEPVFIVRDTKSYKTFKQFSSNDQAADLALMLNEVEDSITAEVTKQVKHDIAMEAYRAKNPSS